VPYIHLRLLLHRTGGLSFFTIKLLRSPLIKRLPCSKIHDLFFDVYLKETSDYEILEMIQPFYAFRGLVVASPVWYLNISLDTMRKLFIKNVLEAEEFDYRGVDRFWKDR
jgi:hypothetical protein